MARSKVTTPSGKKVTPKKKRDSSRKASIHIDSREMKGSSNNRKVTKKNDGDPTVYRKHRVVDVKKNRVTTTSSKTKSKAAANPLKGKRKSIFGIGGAKKTTETGGTQYRGDLGKQFDEGQKQIQNGSLGEAAAKRNKKMTPEARAKLRKGSIKMRSEIGRNYKKTKKQITSDKKRYANPDNPTKKVKTEKFFKNKK